MGQAASYLNHARDRLAHCIKTYLLDLCAILRHSKTICTIQGVRRLGNIIKQDSLHSFGITIDGHYRVSQGMTEFLLLT